MTISVEFETSPASNREHVTRKWRKPRIMVLPADATSLKPDVKGDGKQRKFDILLHMPVENLVGVKLRHASDLITGVEVDLAPRPSKREPNPKPYVYPVSSLPERTYTVDLHRYIASPVRVTISPYRLVGKNYGIPSGHGDWSREHCDVGYILAMIARTYARMYTEHAKYGVHGHGLADLCFTRLRIDGNIIKVDIES